MNESWLCCVGNRATDSACLTHSSSRGRPYWQLKTVEAENLKLDHSETIQNCKNSGKHYRNTTSGETTQVLVAERTITSEIETLDPRITGTKTAHIKNTNKIFPQQCAQALFEWANLLLTSFCGESVHKHLFELANDRFAQSTIKFSRLTCVRQRPPLCNDMRRQAMATKLRATIGSLYSPAHQK